MKRNSKGQFVKGSGGGGGGGKGKRKGKGKGTGGTLDARVKRLEQNQALLVGVVDGMEARLTNVENVVSKLAGVAGERFARKGKRKGKRAPASV